MCTDGSASKLGNTCKTALVQQTATAKAAVVQRQQQQRWQRDSDIAKTVVPAKMTAPEKAAAQAQQSQQRWQQRCFAVVCIHRTGNTNNHLTINWID
jgi:hypothetical protein